MGDGHVFPSPRCESRSEDHPEHVCDLPLGHPLVRVEGGLFQHAAPRGGVYWSNSAPTVSAKERAVTDAYNIVTGADGEEWNPDRTLAALNALWDEASRTRP